MSIAEPPRMTANELLTRAGVAEVWQVNPTMRTVTVYADGGRRVSHLHEDDELTGGTVLPGFACRVAEMFPPRASAPGA